VWPRGRSAVREGKDSCPGVGMVLLEIQVGGGDAKAELKSYGMLVTIE
jgi:hypothetical protein